jgi:hypothetical protein
MKLMSARGRVALLLLALCAGAPAADEAVPVAEGWERLKAIADLAKSRSSTNDDQTTRSRDSQVRPVYCPGLAVARIRSFVARS